MKVPSALVPTLGPGETQIGTAPDGTPIVAPDDLALGANSFNGMWNQSAGNLQDLSQRGAQVADAVNTLGDSHSSPDSQIQAIASIGSVVAGAALYGMADLGIITFATVTSSLPIVGGALAVFVLVAVGFAKLAGVIFGNAQGKPIDQREAAFDQVLSSIPSDGFSIPGLVVTPQAIQVMQALADGITGRVDGDPNAWGDARLNIGTIFGGATDRASRITDACEIIFSDRWTMPRKVGQMFNVGAAHKDCAAPEPHPCFWDEYSYTEIAQNANGLVLHDALFSSDPGVDPFAAYWYAWICVLAETSGVSNARGLAATVLYQIMLYRGWVYRSADRQVPNEELSLQGYLLDIIHQSPYNRTLVNMHPQTGLTSQVTIVKDLPFYVGWYLWEKDQARKSENVAIQVAPMTRAGLR